ncbi:MAG: DUF1987 domain-containing protein [Bacteroidota bacterium]|nr:DUF1987 domain-containing protein [Bacteroidota bacterium]
METLDVKGDDINPTVLLNHIENVFVISGESRPENPLKYYEPVFKWFNDYFNYAYVLNDLANSETLISKKLKVDLDYFNSTSAKVLFDLFSLLKNTGAEKYKVIFEIDWFYHLDDTDMLDAGKEMESMCGLKFNFISK